MIAPPQSLIMPTRLTTEVMITDI